MKKQKKYTLLEFTQDFSTREAGSQEYFDPGHAAELIKRGVAIKVYSETEQPKKETKLKTSKKKKDEKNTDDTAV